MQMIIPCLGNSFTYLLKNRPYPKIQKLASSVNLYRFTHFFNFAAGSIFKNCLLGQHPQSPLNNTKGVGCAFVLNDFGRVNPVQTTMQTTDISYKQKNCLLQISQKFLSICWLGYLFFPGLLSGVCISGKEY